jgi:uncharacterized membrane protein
MQLELLRWLHVIGAAVILGTGAGIAFFLVMANRTKNAAFIAQTASVVIVADWVFTASAVLLQPVTGFLLARSVGWSMGEGWILASLALYGVAGAFWLPVVWIQYRLRDLASEAARTGGALPPRYHTLYRVWFAFGVPGFASVLAIVWLMLARPAIAF